MLLPSTIHSTRSSPTGTPMKYSTTYPMRPDSLLCDTVVPPFVRGMTSHGVRASPVPDVSPSNDGEPSQTPGIWTTDRSGSVGYNPGIPSRGDAAGNYTNDFGGTSSACPGVAGVAALILSRNPALRHAEVKDVIRRACDPIDRARGRYDARGHSPLYGYGRVNARRAVELARP